MLKRVANPGANRYFYEINTGEIILLQVILWLASPLAEL